MTSMKVRLPVIGARSRSTRGPFLCWPPESGRLYDLPPPPPCLGSVARWQFGGSWFFPRPSCLLFYRIPHPLCIYLWEAATLSQPPGVPDLGSRSPEHGSQGGILLSCRAPGFPDSWHLAATPPDGGGLFPWWLHCDRLVAAVLNACRSPGQRCIFPPHPGVGRERLACFLASLIATVDISWAYTF